MRIENFYFTILYNLVEYEVKELRRPDVDPDPWIPSDGYYPKWYDFFPIYQEKNGIFYSITEITMLCVIVSTFCFLLHFCPILLMIVISLKRIN